MAQSDYEIDFGRGAARSSQIEARSLSTFLGAFLKPGSKIQDATSVGWSQ
jgi:hypothetical protein